MKCTDGRITLSLAEAVEMVTAMFVIHGDIPETAKVVADLPGMGLAAAIVQDLILLWSPEGRQP